jgi:hypothetical protein
MTNTFIVSLRILKKSNAFFQQQQYERNVKKNGFLINSENIC